MMATSLSLLNTSPPAEYSRTTGSSRASSDAKVAGESVSSRFFGIMAGDGAAVASSSWSESDKSGGNSSARLVLKPLDSLVKRASGSPSAVPGRACARAAPEGMANPRSMRATSFGVITPPTLCGPLCRWGDGTGASLLPLADGCA